jgi:hypothetical protein
VGPHAHKASEMAEMTIEEDSLGKDVSTEGDRIGATPTDICLNEAEVSY